MNDLTGRAGQQRNAVNKAVGREIAEQWIKRGTRREGTWEARLVVAVS